MGSFHFFVRNAPKPRENAFPQISDQFHRPRHGALVKVVPAARPLSPVILDHPPFA